MSGAMTEFRITSDLSLLRQQIITANFEEVRDWLEENLAPYRDMAVSADDISTAKAYRANIRKVKDRIEQSRKEAKSAALEAYSGFEARCKQLTGLCDEAANAIDAQVKAIEEAEKQEKIEKLHSEYVALTDDETETYCPWARIFNEKWGNKGFSFEAALVEIKTALENTKNDVETVRSMGGDDTAYLLDVYKQTHDLSAVIRKASEIKTMREREAARKREAAARAQEEAELLERAAEAAHAPVIREQNTEEPFLTVDFRVRATKSQLAALGDFMKKNGIKYGRIEG